MAEITAEQWAAFFVVAGVIQEVAGSGVPPGGPVEGRSITDWVERLVQFWNDHRDTLAPVLSQLAIAALEALVAALPDILAVNGPGPG